MRSLLLSVLFATACAHSAGPRPINVHAVRVEIKHTIEEAPGDLGPRTIISMGKVTRDSAVVYTEAPARGRHEETWVRGPAGWSLSESRQVAAATR
jgi:hypothetical protein